MGRYTSFSTDPQKKKRMTSYSKQTGEESLPYNVININDLFIENGRIDVFSKIVYGIAGLWYIIMNKNYNYRDPFELLTKDFEITGANGKKFIKIPVLDTQSSQLSPTNNSETSVNNTMDL